MCWTAKDVKNDTIHQLNNNSDLLDWVAKTLNIFMKKETERLLLLFRALLFSFSDEEVS